MLHKAVIGQAGSVEPAARFSLKSEISPVAAAWFAVCEGEMQLSSQHFEADTRLVLTVTTSWGAKCDNLANTFRVSSLSIVGIAR